MENKSLPNILLDILSRLESIIGISIYIYMCALYNIYRYFFYERNYVALLSTSALLGGILIHIQTLKIKKAIEEINGIKKD